MSEADSVAEVNPNIEDDDPSCHVCGAVMCKVRVWQERPYGYEKVDVWKCQSCGTTTGCS